MKKDKCTAVDFVKQVYGSALLGFYNSLQNPILMEDNAPVHTANYARKWREEHGFEKLKWPAQLPDLDPIENLWYQMKIEIKLNGMGMRTMDDLKEVMEDALDNVPKA